MPKAKSSIQIKNRRASFDYEFLETYTAGIQLVGTEIKSIRAGKCSLQDAYCFFVGNELFVRGMNIALYHWGTWNSHEPVRDRRLLLNRKELRHLQQADKQKGLTIVAVKLFIADNGFAKLVIALAKGKKEYDKRQSIKECIWCRLPMARNSTIPPPPIPPVTNRPMRKDCASLGNSTRR